MKILMLTLFLLSYPLKINAQSRIGSSLSEIKSEFPNSKFNIEYKVLTDTSSLYTVRDELITCIYLFAHSKCTSTFIIPQTSIVLKNYVEEYNSKYVIVSDKQWKAYLGNGICRIDMEFPKNGNLPFFLWTRIE
jgi:hypothetical protein